MSLHGKFKDEAEFRDKFVKPLLNRLGFYGVEEQHGSNEFGKDFVFSELHRLGGMRHYAAQVKYEERINQGAKVDELLSQIRQAFAVTFKRGDSPRDCHVSSVYVFNSGEITDNARTFIAGQLVKEHYGDNVHFLYGDRLEGLNQWETYQSDRQARTRLVALVLHLNVNIKLWESIREEEDGSPISAQAPLMHGLEAYISEPVDEDAINLPLLYHVVALSSAVERIRFQLSLATADPPETRERSRRIMRDNIDLLLKNSEVLQGQIMKALDRVSPIG